MAEQQMTSSSSSSSAVSSKKYDVFLSFRGKDTRYNITSHLHKALKQMNVETYIDYELKRGDEISLALIEAIKDSLVSIVILSENYASSKWCLEELRQILECKKTQGQIVLPLFYNIDPSNVRNQTGSYEVVFAKHKGNSNYNEWKIALTEVAGLAGWDSRGCNESELLKKIVGDVSAVLQSLTPGYSDQFEELVGIEYNYEPIESLLKIESSETRTIGIWGMGGIGKTTLATVLYAKLSHEYDAACFLENVRENSERHGLKALRNKLGYELLEEENHCFGEPLLISHSDRRRLARKKVLIVLDDVDTIKQLEFLIKGSSLLRSGSRIIVTTRNKQIFHQVVDEYYEVKELSFHRSLQLLCLTAFGEEQPKHGYEYLSKSVVSYCGGNPLALKVVGTRLRGRSIDAWDSELRKLQEIPNIEMHNVLKISYDGLEPSEKDIFLDIACFFKGELRYWVTNLLEASNFYAASGIEVLLDKALITISGYYCRIEMHDLIQEMGWKIVKESNKDPGKRSRLWKPEEVREVLKYNRGTDAVEGMILDLNTLTEDLYLSSNFLAKMTNMRFLKIHTRSRSMSKFKVYLLNGLESLPHKLRFLYWDGFSLESLPSNFCAEQLVEFHITDSKVKKLWDGVQNLANLKIIWLCDCPNLIEMPDLSMAKKLKSVKLSHCERLRQLHPSMLSLAMLTSLIIYHCREFDLNGCSSLKEFPKTSKEMTNWKLFDTSRCVLPSSILHNGKHTSLCLRGSNKLDELSDDSRMGSIMEPDHCGCPQQNAWKLSSLQAFFHNINHFTCLYYLNRSRTNIESLDASIKNLLLLKTLQLSKCRKLVSLSKLPPSLEYLDFIDCRKLVSLLELPPSLEYLELSCCEKLPPSLKYLNLSGCGKLVSLPELPPSLKDLNLSGCGKLLSLPELPPSLVFLNLSGCGKLLSLPELPPSLKNLDLSGCGKLVSLPELPPSLKYLYLSGCGKLVSLPELPPSLECLYLSGCGKLVSLPELPPSLFRLDLRGCGKLVSLPELPPSLVFIDDVLDLSGCGKLVSLPELPPSLEDLNLSGCGKLVSLPELPPSLKYLYLSGCGKLVSLPELPPSLKYLYLSGCGKLVSLPELPPSLEDLNLSGCGKLVSLPELPPSLEYLNLSGCRKLVSLPELPPSLEYLYLSGCGKLVSLPELPPSLFRLDLRGCGKLVSLPELPPSLEDLNLSGCGKLVSLPELPPSLEDLNLSGCGKLVSLPELPLFLEDLNLSGCGKLVTLPELPPCLEDLNLNGCRKLVSWPELPPSLRYLYLSDCGKLVSLPKLPPYLKKLYLDDCRKLVSLPEIPALVYMVTTLNCTSLDTNSTRRLLLQQMLQKCMNNISYVFPNKQAIRATRDSITIPHPLCGCILAIVVSIKMVKRLARVGSL